MFIEFLIYANYMRNFIYNVSLLDYRANIYRCVTVNLN